MPSSKTLVNPSTFQAVLNRSEAATAFQALCAKEEVQPYLVGGAVRDFLLTGELSPDLDYVVPDSHTRSLAEQIAKQLDGKFLCLDEQYQIYRVILFPNLDMLDIAACMGDTITTDLFRRDFTINAMAYDFATGEILDPTGGLSDLRQGRMRMVKAENFLEDPLRLIRLFRIAAELGFEEIDPATLSAVYRHSEALLKVASERIHYELMKLFSARECARLIRLMAEIGLLEHLFPELSATRGIPANRYHHLNLYDHTLELLTQAELHFPDLPPEIQAYLNEPLNPFIKRIAAVRLACLFHDVGKPATMAYDAELDKYKFYGHDMVSEELTLGIAHRLKWGKELSRLVTHLVRWHLYPGDMLRPEITPRGLRKFFRRLGDSLPEMLLLALADRFSAQGPAITPSELADSKAGLLNLWSLYNDYKSVEETKPKLLTGREIMSILGIEPGPQVGQILDDLNDAYLNAELSTREEALSWLQAKYRNH